MNAEAARLGATSTVARNPSGLDEPGQRTTARDLAVIGRAGLANPEIAGYLKLASVQFPGEPGANGVRFMYPIYNHNRMLTDGFSGALGGKSGFTSQAGRTFVGAAQRGGHRLLVAMLGIGPNTYTTPERLLTWAFANYDRLSPVGQLAEPSSPAPTFDRTVRPVAAPEAPAATAAKSASRSSDAPTSTEGASTWGLPGLPGLPHGMPSMLQILTLVMAVLVALRARVYWIGHRSRSAWIDLDTWTLRAGRKERLCAARSRAEHGTGTDPAPSSTAADPAGGDQAAADPDDETAGGNRLVDAPA
jgi:serine-type D-Ala-D-Ala carboxypeptidase (penicillin-binding protein 5/6)